MDNYLDQLVTAIETRKSKRKLQKIYLNKEHLQKLQEFLSILTAPFDHSVDITIHSLPEKYSVFLLADMRNIVAFSAPNTLLDQAKVGFLGEIFILYCESLGVNTCWIGHFKKENTYQIVYGTTEENAPKRIHCISPLGYAPEKTPFVDNVFGHTRKPWEEKLLPDSLKDFPVFIKNAFHLAMKAPSAMNSQCWTFKVEENENNYQIEISKPDGYRHFKWPYPDIDVGTAAAHFYLSCLQQGHHLKISLDDNNKKVTWKFSIQK